MNDFDLRVTKLERELRQVRKTVAALIAATAKGQVPPISPGDAKALLKILHGNDGEED